MSRMPQARAQRGFLIIAAVFLLIVLAGLVAYLTTVSSTSQAASAADINSTRAAFTATVTCTNVTVTEGASTTLKAYSIVSTACNEPACPNATTQSSTYV